MQDIAPKLTPTDRAVGLHLRRSRAFLESIHKSGVSCVCVIGEGRLGMSGIEVIGSLQFRISAARPHDQQNGRE